LVVASSKYIKPIAPYVMLVEEMVFL